MHIGSPVLRHEVRAARRASGTLALLVCLAAAPTAHAESREDGAPAESLGAGDNVRASVWGPAALFYNPAGMSRARALIIEGGYSYLDGRDGHAFTAAAVDAATNPYVALGVAYSYLTGAPDGVDRDGHQFRGALSTSYLTQDVGLYAGVGARYLTLTVGADDAKSEEHNDVDAWTVDLGLMLELAHRIRFGVVGANLVDTQSAEAPRTLGLGLGFLFDTLEVSADLDVDLTDAGAGAIGRYGFGLQYGFANTFNARLGLIVDPRTDEQRIAGGLGYAAHEYALDLGYSSAVSGDSDMLFSVSIRYTPPQNRR